MDKKQGIEDLSTGQENIQARSVKPSSAGHKRKSSEVTDENANVTKKARTGTQPRTSEESEPESASPSDDDGWWFSNSAHQSVLRPPYPSGLTVYGIFSLSSSCLLFFLLWLLRMDVWTSFYISSLASDVCDCSSLPFVFFFLFSFFLLIYLLDSVDLMSIFLMLRR